MRWRKLGLVYCPDGSRWWAKSHAMIPTPLRLDEERVRVFITCCDAEGVGRVGYVDVSAHDPRKVLGVASEPVLDIGKDGTFDENGVLACSAIKAKGRYWMYYAGFELGRKIRYRLLTGCATAGDPAGPFRRVWPVPVLERSEDELFFRCGPFVRHEDGRFRLWYVAGSGWERVGGSLKPVYEIRYAESEDGIHWPRKGQTCIAVERDDEHGFGRPYVVFHEGKYRMFYSVRRRDVASYRLGYAESDDGLHWERKDEEVGLDVSDSGWDAEMICYSAVIQLRGRWFMFYNGNDFGRTGFGVAELIAW